MQYYFTVESHMQEQFPQGQLPRRGVVDGKITVIVRWQSFSLQLLVPLQWEVNKLKCVLCQTIPKLDFGMVRLDHDGEELPGMMTFAEILERDRDEECISHRQFVIWFTKKENNPIQFQMYYAQKMRSFLSKMRYSPFQPLLNPKYSSLQNQYMPLEQINQNTRKNFQSLFNLRTLIQQNRNRDRGQAADNQPANQEGAEIQNVEGVGVLGPRPAANGNIFQRGAFWIFKILQVLLLWQLIQLVYNHISTAHIFILIAIILAYFCIEHFQKAKNQGNQRQADGANIVNQGQRQQHQAQRPQQVATQKQKQGTIGSEVTQQQNLSQIEANMQRSGLPNWFLKTIKLFCLSVQVVLSFFMSLFPNWTIQLHNNMLQDKFNKIDRKLQQWQHLHSVEKGVGQSQGYKSKEDQEEIMKSEGEGEQVEGSAQQE